MGYVLGIDLGTSSLKGVLMDEGGNILATSTSDYELIQEEVGYSEQCPEDWLHACQLVLCELKDNVEDFGKKLEGISFSGQMHSLVVLNKDFEPLRNAILWNDVRTTKQCEAIMKKYGNEIVDITSNIALEGFTLPKILWLQEFEPNIWAEVRHILLPKDYLGFWMTGNIYTDYSDASGTIMLDMKNKIWSEKILNSYNISKEIMPNLIESSGCTGVLKEELSMMLGCENEVKIFAGGADNACAAIGAGILDDKTGLVSIGTSGVFLSYEEKNHALYNGDIHLFNHGIPNGYYSMGVTLAAGHSLSWFKETFAHEKTFTELINEINNIEVGSNGLLFSPYIVGERTPYTDSKIRGSFIGIDTQHRLQHFTRAVVEGITFSLKDSQQLMEKVASKKFNKIVSVGGGAKSQEWLQIQADIFDSNILCLRSEQGPGVGAAMIAAMGLNWFDDMEECAKVYVKYKEIIEPQQENVSKYKKIYKLYKNVYASTKDICHDLTNNSKDDNK